MARALTVTEARDHRHLLVRWLAALATGAWDPRFQGDAEEGARFTVSRALPLVRPDIDCVLSLERVSISDVAIVNPMRMEATPFGGYPMLRRRLESDPGYDSVPLSMGRSRQGVSLWDGHRRLETYRSAGRSDVPAWTASFRPGRGLLAVVDQPG